jgi:copper chaperone CopZ
MGQCLCCRTSDDSCIENVDGTIIVSFNNKTIEYKNARSAYIRNNRIIVDGVDRTNEFTISQTNMMVIINVHGNAGHVQTISGDIKIAGNVTNNVSTISGDVVASGKIGGNVSTVSGDVKIN